MSRVLPRGSAGYARPPGSVVEELDAVVYKAVETGLDKWGFGSVQVMYPYSNMIVAKVVLLAKI
jgi:hypothetical protein